MKLVIKLQPASFCAAAVVTEDGTVSEVHQVPLGEVVQWAKGNQTKYADVDEIELYGPKQLAHGISDSLMYTNVFSKVTYKGEK